MGQPKVLGHFVWKKTRPHDSRRGKGKSGPRVLVCAGVAKRGDLAYVERQDRKFFLVKLDWPSKPVGYRQLFSIDWSYPFKPIPADKVPRNLFRIPSS